MTEQRKGLFAALAAYTIWGLFPLYWPLLAPAGPYEMVAHRIVWSCVTSLVLVWGLRRVTELRALWANPRQRRLVVIAAVLVTINWTAYIWAINNSRVVETALGYFINPLVTVFLGVFVLREKLRTAQWVALGLAAAAVVVLTVGYGQLPWVALLLACTFGTYGLLKKQADAGALESMTVESAVITPVALAYLVWLMLDHQSHVWGYGAGHVVLLISTGLATIVPLMLFTVAATRVPLVTLGLTQYLAPVIQFLIGVLVLNEPMPPERLIGFVLVWVAVFLVAAESLWHARSRSAA